jgi:catechol 2,3-dioxygenase-like lactoylglutathione lyase family enzyme
MLQFNNIDHINFTVKDLKRSSDFYQSIFGFKIFEDKMRNGSQYQILGLSGKRMVCLYENKGKSFIKREFKESNINHVGFNIEFYPDIVKDLEEKNVKVRYYDGEAIINYPHSRSIYIRDPDEMRLRLRISFVEITQD